MTSLDERQILLGVSGGIAAYKALELTRLLRMAGARVRVIMTRNATEFVSPLSFQTLSENPVCTNLFDLEAESRIGHIEVATAAEVAVLAPATANVIGKLAAGIADDYLTTAWLACPAPKIICPAMNVNMYQNEVVQENLAKLRQRGYFQLGPDAGDLACGVQGLGRLVPPERIVEEIHRVLTPQDLRGKRVLVTAGPTWEALDPVRHLSNRSSGKMGYSLAKMARRRGAEVVLVSGPTALSPPAEVELQRVESAREMYQAVAARFGEVDAVVMAAAVSDYRPRFPVEKKIKKDQAGSHLELEPTEDILASLGAQKQRQLLVGFAAETNDLLTNARAKLREKNLDLIVANDVAAAEGGFGSDFNAAVLLWPDGRTEHLPMQTKESLASAIWDRVAELMHAGGDEQPQSVQV